MPMSMKQGDVMSQESANTEPDMLWVSKATRTNVKTTSRSRFILDSLVVWKDRYWQKEGIRCKPSGVVDYLNPQVV